MNRLALTLAFLASATFTLAQQPDKTTETVRLTLRPAHPPAPLLKHRLTADLIDQVQGNAAILYLVANNRMASVWTTPPAVSREKEEDQVDKWLKTPIADLPKAAVRPFLERYRTALDQMRLASVRDRCEFDPPYRTEGFRTLLPYLNEARSLSKLVALQARYQAADGNFDAAVDSLRIIFVQGRHLNTESFLVQSLVAAGITMIALDQARDLAQAKDGPNLYWALTQLPVTMFDVRASLRFERAGLYFSVPGLKEARDGKVSGAGWQPVMSNLITLQEQVSNNDGGGVGPKIVTALMTMRDLPLAQKYVAEKRKTTVEAITNLPAAEVLGQYYVAQYERWMQEVEAHSSLPPAQGLDALRRMETRLDDERKASASPVLMLLPAMSRAYLSLYMVDRRVAMLRTVEAIRAYAATHDARPPKALADVTETPVPNDPCTGKPFAYTVNGDTITLEAPPIEGAKGRATGLKYEMTIVE